MTVTAVLPFNLTTERADHLMSSNDNEKMYISTPTTSPVQRNTTCNNNNNNNNNTAISPHSSYGNAPVVKTEFASTLPMHKKIQLPPISSFDKLVTAISHEASQQPKVKLENRDHQALYQSLAEKRRSRAGSVPMLPRNAMNIPILAGNNSITTNSRAVPTPEATTTMGPVPNTYFAPFKSKSSSPSMASPITLPSSNAPYLLPSASFSGSNGTVSSSNQSPQYYVHSCNSTTVSTPRSEVDMNRGLQQPADNKNNNIKQLPLPVPKLASVQVQPPQDTSRRSSHGSQGNNNDSSSGSKQRKKRECPICHKFFANLSTHKSTHLTSQDRPHKCVICQRGFARNNDLIRHKKRHWKDNLDVLTNPELSSNVELQQDSIAKQRELKKSQLKSLHQIKGAFQCPYNTNLIEVDLELYPYKVQNGVLNFKPIDCHQTGVFSRCDTYKNHLKALHFEYPPRTKREQRGIVPGRCRHCGEKFPNVDVWLNQHVGKTCGFPYH